MDVTTAITAIQAATTPINLIGSAVFGVLVIAATWGWLRRVL